jgi:3-oxoacid CoA-transferase subunit A
VFARTARNFNPDVATAGRITIAEVDELVPLGTIDADAVHLPGIFVDRIVENRDAEKRIERRSVRSRATKETS